MVEASSILDITALDPSSLLADTTLKASSKSKPANATGAVALSESVLQAQLSQSLAYVAVYFATDEC
jgi:hypothetical protein